MSKANTIAFLGGGNMALAILCGLIKEGASTATEIRVAEPDQDRRHYLFERHAVTGFADNAEACQGADVVVVAVKPGVVPAALAAARPGIGPDALVISIAAGVTLSALAQVLPPDQPLVRAMPNTPALINAGITALVAGPATTPGQLALARQVLGAVGETVVLDDEKQMDGVTALSGSGPAYVFLLLEALSDGGVLCGLPRPLADRLAQQTLIGATRLVQESGNHPGVLKNQVTSPGGTTIAGLQVLERAGVRGALMDAVTAAWQRSRELG